MKRCDEIKEKLFACLDGPISEEDKRLIEEHVRACQSCANILDEHTKMKALMDGLNEIEPPPWLAPEIMSRIKEDQEAGEGWFRKLFFPLHIKVPAEALAAVFVIVISIFVYRSTIPDIKNLERPLPEVRTQGQGPAGAVRSVEPDPIKKKVPAKPSRVAIEEKKAAKSETAIVTKPREEMRRPQETVVMPPIAKYQTAQAPHAGSEAAKPVVTETRTIEGPAALKDVPHPAPEKQEKSYATGARPDREAARAPVMRSARSDNSRQRQILTMVLIAGRPDKAAHETGEILRVLGATRIEKKQQGNNVKITAQIDGSLLDELKNRLEKIGFLNIKDDFTKTLPGQVSIEMFVSSTPVNPPELPGSQ